MTQPSLGPIRSPIQWVPGSFLWGKAADVKSERSCTFTPPVRYTSCGNTSREQILDIKATLRRLTCFALWVRGKFLFVGQRCFVMKFPGSKAENFDLTNLA